LTVSSTHPATPDRVERAVILAAGAVALSAVIAGAMLVSSVTGTASTEAPAPTGSEVVISAPGHPTGPTITANGDEERRGGMSNPLHAD
jgi:hypothetical protein